MIQKYPNIKLNVILLIFSILMLGVMTQSDLTALGQSDAAQIKGKVTDETSFDVGERVEFEIEINMASDSACDDGAWMLEFGDGRSTQGSTSATRNHTYLRAGAYNAVLSYTYFENVGSAAPDCRAQSAGDSVAVVINEAEMPDSTTADEPVRFVSTDSNWFNPENWSTGRVPVDGDTIEIGGDAIIIIDPALDPRNGEDAGTVEFASLRLVERARLETRSGTELQFDQMYVGPDASFFTQSTVMNGNTVQRENGASTSGNGGGGGGGCSGWNCGYNPSYVEVERFEFAGEGLALYLGGTTQASATGVGPGHYSFINAQNVTLNQASLQINLIYDFEPQAGDEFIILEASEFITGTFANFADGDVVLSTSEVNLEISYTVNQVVLTAQAQ